MNSLGTKSKTENSATSSMKNVGKKSLSAEKTTHTTSTSHNTQILC